MITMLDPLTMDTVRALVEPLTPAATVYLGRPAGTSGLDDEETVSLRMRPIATELRASGAPTTTVEAVKHCMASLSAHPAETAIVARASTVLLCQSLPGLTGSDRVRYGAPGDVAPILLWMQQHPPYVTALVDRVGADVTRVPSGTLTGVTRRVEGPDDEIERNAPGGWSQPRYQRRAEDSWRHNAAAVADAAVEDLRRVGTDLLLVGGDVRATQLLRERLPDRIIVRPLPGGRHADGSLPARAVAVENQVWSYTHDRLGAELAEFEAEGSPRGLAVTGVANTLAALAAGRVRTLLIGDEPNDDRTAWFNSELLCVDESTMAGALNRRSLRPGRLVDVAIRAAILTDARVRILGPDQAAGLAESIGALCRYPA